MARAARSVLYSGWLMLAAASASLLAAFVLSIESLHLAKHPNVALSCDLNAAISCSTVAKHPTAELLGFPNSFIGMVSEPVFIVIAVLLLAGVVFPRWIVRGLVAGATLALVFAGWMFYTSYVVIGALCPWCLVVTISSIVLWFATMRLALTQRVLGARGAFAKRLDHIVAKDYDKFAMCVIIVAIIVLIVVKYG